MHLEEIQRPRNICLNFCKSPFFKQLKPFKIREPDAPLIKQMTAEVLLDSLLPRPFAQRLNFTPRKDTPMDSDEGILELRDDVNASAGESHQSPLQPIQMVQDTQATQAPPEEEKQDDRAVAQNNLNWRRITREELPNAALQAEIPIDALDLMVQSGD